MSTEKPQYHAGLVKIPLRDGDFIELTPQESWDMVDNVKSYLVDSYSSLDPTPIRKVEKNGRHFSVALTENTDFWRKLQKGRWEPHTFQIFDSLLTAEHIFLDIGAWIGPTALYAAQLAKRAYAFEPDPIAYQELKTNISVNQETEWAARLSIHNQAIAPESGTVKLGSRKRGGDSMSSVLFADRETSWEVKAGTLQQFIEAENLQHEKLFIKIDIEGGEYVLLPGIKDLLSRHDVVLYLSAHPFYIAESMEQDKERGMLKKISQRLVFTQKQFGLIRSLPFKYLYHKDGRPLRRYVELLKALLLGEFAHEIIATDTRRDKGF